MAAKYDAVKKVYLAKGESDDADTAATKLFIAKGKGKMKPPKPSKMAKPYKPTAATKEPNYG